MAKSKLPLPSPLLGSHMSIAGGVELAPARAASVGCTAMQIFVKNNNRWDGKPITAKQAEAFRRELEKAEIALVHVFAHTGYLINLASAKEDVRAKSEISLEDELRRCHLLGLPGIVMHPGAHLGQGREKGIELIADACRRVFDRIGDGPTRLLFETTVGSGTNMGGAFEDLRDVLASVDRSDRTGVCMDTCHIFAAGYEIRTPEAYAETMRQLDTVVGIGNVRAIHLNDSKGDFASRKDRHAHIGEGHIGLEGFRHLLNDARFRLVPMSLETEKGEDLAEDRRNLATLRSLVA